MWEKCGTYSRRERAEGAVRHVLPQVGGGVGGGGGRRTRNRDHIYAVILQRSPANFSVSCKSGGENSRIC